MNVYSHIPWVVTSSCGGRRKALFHTLARLCSISTAGAVFSDLKLRLCWNAKNNSYFEMTSVVF